ncbi:MAG: hypothetical protein E7368_02800 [Clostridiales bacterium]|nr:hypothetical protein [Clostridiales bacterium]
MDEKEKIEKALVKVALGFQVAEVTEEYAEVDGELKLTKRKKTKKDVPPDLKAVQLLLAERGLSYAEMTDEELEREKKRLLAELGEAEKKALKLVKEDGQVCVEKEKEAKKTERKPRSKPRKRVNRNKKEGDKA